MNHLEKAILDIIEKRYKRKYVGGIQVKQLITGGYKLTLYLNKSDRNTIDISADLKEKDFLKYVEQELIERQLHKVDFFTGIKTYIEDDERGTYRED